MPERIALERAQKGQQPHQKGKSGPGHRGSREKKSSSKGVPAMAEQRHQHWSAWGKGAKESHPEYWYTGNGQGGQASPSSHYFLGYHAGATGSKGMGAAKSGGGRRNWHLMQTKIHGLALVIISKHLTSRKIGPPTRCGTLGALTAHTSRLRMGCFNLRGSGVNFRRCVRPLARTAKFVSSYCKTQRAIAESSS